LAEGKDSVPPPEHQRSINASHMSALIKPPTGHTRRVDLAPITSVSSLPEAIEKSESESDIEVVPNSPASMVAVIEKDRAITSPLEGLQEDLDNKEVITPPSENYDSALVTDQGIFQIYISFIKY